MSSSDETFKKKYMSLHMRVRNDDHCPICRMYYISIHHSLTDAIENCSSGNYDDLEKGNVICIDEWDRRRNSDKYQAFELTLGRIYDMSSYNINDKERYKYDQPSNNGSVRAKQKKVDNNVQYMLLHIKVRSKCYCPDNIKFEISFYKTFNEAFLTGKGYLKRGKIISDFRKMPVWQTVNDIECLDDHDGDHYQIIKLECDKRICLNTYCTQIQPKNWLKLNK